MTAAVSLAASQWPFKDANGASQVGVTPGVDANGNLLVSAPTTLPLPTAPSTSAPTSVAAAAAATVILAANPLRKRYSVFNDSTAVMYVLENSGTVSTTNYSYQIQPSGYFNTTEWQGPVNAIWASANGAARVTEYTA